MIRVAHLTKTYRNATQPAVDDVSFLAKQGAFYTLLGPSGCGKTTTLRCIAGLERPDAGLIQLGETVVVADGVFVPAFRRGTGMVFQNYAVWPHMTVFENVAFPLRVGPRLKESVIRNRVESALELVGLVGLDKRMATQLSGGQQQRLSVARAFIREPEVILLDEPLSNLDARLRERMRRELLLILRRVGITTLFVTHDQVEALSMSDRIAVMNGGRIVQEGAPREIYGEPKDEFVAGFIGATNLIQGQIVARDPSAGLDDVTTSVGTLRVAAVDIPIGAAVMVAIRPEDVRLHFGEPHGESHIAPVNELEGVVEVGLYVGASIEYHVRVRDEVIQARISSRVDLAAGAAARVEFRPELIRVFAMDAGTSTPRHQPDGTDVPEVLDRK